MDSTTERRRTSQPGHMDLESFVERSRAKHGDRYDYSQAVYVNTKTKLAIVCPEHGVFWQTPEKHMSGCGCPHPDCVKWRKAETCLEKYGVTHQSKVESIKQQKKETMRSRYGAENPMQVVEFREKHDVACKRRGFDDLITNGEVK